MFKKKPAVEAMSLEEKKEEVRRLHLSMVAPGVSGSERAAIAAEARRLVVEVRKEEPNSVEFGKAHPLEV